MDQADALLNLLTLMEPNGIEKQEARGQRQLLASQKLPKDGPWTEATALGFVRGKDVDDLFCEATLPAGWQKQGTDHSMWSDIVDAEGKKRAAIFYKAAFYDRSAHWYLVAEKGGQA